MGCWSAPKTTAARRRLEQRYGLPEGGAEYLVLNSETGLRTQRGELSEAENWQHVQQVLVLSDAELAAFRAEFWAGDRLDEELMTFIRRLHGRYQTAIISNALPGLRTLLTGKYPIADAFDVIVGSGDERVMKPDPAIYHLALERLSCEPAAAIFIDDAPRNVEGARAVGMHAIQYVPGLDLPGALAAYGVTP